MGLRGFVAPLEVSPWPIKLKEIFAIGFSLREIALLLAKPNNLSILNGKWAESIKFKPTGAFKTNGSFGKRQLGGD